MKLVSRLLPFEYEKRKKRRVLNIFVQRNLGVKESY
jgi:hypothetical protein